MTTTKTEIVADIARRLGFEPPPMSRGSTEPRILFTMIIERIGLDTQASTKHDLARAIVESAGHVWYRSYESRGGTVTLNGLAAVRAAVSALVPEEGVRPHFRLAESIPSSGAPNSMVLVEDNWDDLLRYETTYTLVFFDARGSRRIIGDLKIGQLGMGLGHRVDEDDGHESIRRPTLPHTFDRLGDNFFSLGQDSDYYNRLAGLGADLGTHVLTGLRDMAFDDEIYQLSSNEPVLKTSVLRSVPRTMMTGQFRRIAHGGAKLSTYNFAFSWTNKHSTLPVQMRFQVEPHSIPPTNLHAIIGRNGAGKTRLLQAMAHAAVQASTDSRSTVTDASWFESPDASSGTGPGLPFSSLVLASFSAFDELRPPKSTGKTMSFTSIGFPSATITPAGNPSNLPTLARKLSESIKICMRGDRRRRWHRALRTLESDTIFAEAQLSSFASATERNAAPDPAEHQQVLDAFTAMSSGHKIALLAITQLVQTVEERSLVLIDEPESHLHPPLLASFLRAVTNLLADRNGVGIVATHSPVVVQEVPRKCVSILRRSGEMQVVERPRIETFGENISTLTRDVFGLEVTRSGFHRMLLDEIDGDTSFEDIEMAFGGQLGSEARAVALAAIAGRNAGW